MAGNPVEAERIVVEFRKRRRRQLAVSVPFVVILIGSLWLRDHPGRAPFDLSGNTFPVVFLVVIAAMLAFSLRNWRCPACNRYLGKGFSPSFCPKCETRLQ